ncbi:MAG: hypothetical protein EZS28_022354, partial [Streblomastix strix]
MGKTRIGQYLKSKQLQLRSEKDDNFILNGDLQGIEGFEGYDDEKKEDITSLVIVEMRLIPIFPNKIGILPSIKIRKELTGDQILKMQKTEKVVFQWKESQQQQNKNEIIKPQELEQYIQREKQERIRKRQQDKNKSKNKSTSQQQQQQQTNQDLFQVEAQVAPQYRPVRVQLLIFWAEANAKIEHPQITSLEIQLKELQKKQEQKEKDAIAQKLEAQLLGYEIDDDITYKDQFAQKEMTPEDIDKLKILEQEREKKKQLEEKKEKLRIKRDKEEKIRKVLRSQSLPERVIVRTRCTDVKSEMLETQPASFTVEADTQTPGKLVRDATRGYFFEELDIVTDERSPLIVSLISQEQPDITQQQQSNKEFNKNKAYQQFRQASPFMRRFKSIMGPNDENNNNNTSIVKDQNQQYEGQINQKNILSKIRQRQNFNCKGSTYQYFKEIALTTFAIPVIEAAKNQGEIYLVRFVDEQRGYAVSVGICVHHMKMVRRLFESPKIGMMMQLYLSPIHSDNDPYPPVIVSRVTSNCLGDWDQIADEVVKRDELINYEFMNQQPKFHKKKERINKGQSIQWINDDDSDQEEKVNVEVQYEGYSRKSLPFTCVPIVKRPIRNSNQQEQNNDNVIVLIRASYDHPTIQTDIQTNKDNKRLESPPKVSRSPQSPPKLQKNQSKNQLQLVKQQQQQKQKDQQRWLEQLRFMDLNKIIWRGDVYYSDYLDHFDQSYDEYDVNYDEQGNILNPRSSLTIMSPRLKKQNIDTVETQTRGNKMNKTNPLNLPPIDRYNLTIESHQFEYLRHQYEETLLPNEDLNVDEQLEEDNINNSNTNQQNQPISSKKLQNFIKRFRQQNSPSNSTAKLEPKEQQGQNDQQPHQPEDTQNQLKKSNLQSISQILNQYQQSKKAQFKEQLKDIQNKIKEKQKKEDEMNPNYECNKKPNVDLTYGFSFPVQPQIPLPPFQVINEYYTTPLPLPINVLNEMNKNKQKNQLKRKDEKKEEVDKNFTEYETISISFVNRNGYANMISTFFDPKIYFGGHPAIICEFYAPILTKDTTETALKKYVDEAWKTSINPKQEQLTARSQNNDNEEDFGFISKTPKNVFSPLSYTDDQPLRTLTPRQPQMAEIVKKSTFLMLKGVAIATLADETSETYQTQLKRGTFGRKYLTCPIVPVNSLDLNVYQPIRIDAKVYPIHATNINKINQLKKREPTDIIDEFGEQEENEKDVQWQEDQEAARGETHVFDVVKKKNPNKKEDKQKPKKLKKDQNDSDSDSESQSEQSESSQSVDEELERLLQINEDDLDDYEKEVLHKRIASRNNMDINIDIFDKIMEVKDAIDDKLSEIVASVLYTKQVSSKYVVADYTVKEVVWFKNKFYHSDFWYELNAIIEEQEDEYEYEIIGDAIVKRKKIKKPERNAVNVIATLADETSET